MKGITRKDNSLVYHMIEGNEWRREMPDLDTTVENCIEALLDDDISIEDFEKSKAQFVGVIKYHYGRRELSLEAANNYMKILQAICHNY